MKLRAHGIETDLLPGWEGRISLRTVPSPAGKAAGGAGPESLTGPVGNPGEIPNPVVHLANFALPEGRGDFGSGAVDLMTEEHVLVVLFEYGSESVGKALFRRKGLPTDLRPNMFSSAALQRTLPGQAGCQIFFTAEDRAFCLFTVLGRQHAANRVLPQANATLAATRISTR
jgi:hypothetical protein